MQGACKQPAVHRSCCGSERQAVRGISRSKRVGTIVSLSASSTASACYKHLPMKFLFSFFMACCFLGISWHPAFAFKPIFAMHGISSGHHDWDHFSEFISKHHPGTHFVALPVFEVVDSYVALRQQVNGIIRFISNMSSSQPEIFGQGYHLVCHSQGALLCRCISQEWDGHNISTLVSLAGPQVSTKPSFHLEFSSSAGRCVRPSLGELSS